jgi:hypothetical protein
VLMAESSCISAELEGGCEPPQGVYASIIVVGAPCTEHRRCARAQWGQPGVEPE